MRRNLTFFQTVVIKGKAILIATFTIVSFFSYSQTPRQQFPIKESVGKVKEGVKVVKSLFKKKNEKVKDPNETEQILEIEDELVTNPTLTLDATIIELIIERIMQDDDGKAVEISKTDEEITVTKEYDGWSATFWFSNLNSAHLFGDLDIDGIEEAIIQVHAYYGGNSEHLILYVLSREGNLWKIICEVNASDTQLKGCDTGKFYPKIIKNGFLIGESHCFKKSDPHCCPSLKYQTTVKLENNRLVWIKKE